MGVTKNKIDVKDHPAFKPQSSVKPFEYIKCCLCHQWREIKCYRNLPKGSVLTLNRGIKLRSVKPKVPVPFAFQNRNLSGSKPMVLGQTPTLIIFIPHSASKSQNPNHSSSAMGTKIRDSGILSTYDVGTGNRN